MIRPVRLFALAALVLGAVGVPRAWSATPDVPFFGAKAPNLPDSFMPDRKLNTYTAADWTTGAFTLTSGSGLADLPDVGPDFRQSNPNLLSTNAQDMADLVAELNKPGNKKKVTIRTKSDPDRQFLYIVFEVQDSTVPQVVSTSGDVDGDRVTVMIDPENNKTPPAAGAPDTRFRITYQIPPRGPGAPASSPVGRIYWDRRNGATVTPQDESTLPADFKLAYTGSDLGYTIAMQIPIGWAGLAKKEDFGLGFSIVNVTRNLTFDGFPLAFAISYPNSNVLKPSSVNLPYNSVDQITGWEDQANWGTGYFRGNLNSIIIKGNPPQYHSPDIRIGTEAATKFSDVNDYSVNNTLNWYKYKPVDPCKGRFWGQVHRKVPVGPGMAAGRDVKVRLLFLWGPAGVPPVELYAIGISDPFLVRGDVNHREMYKPVLWDKPVKGLTSHPCVVAVVLPDILDKPPYDKAKFDAFNTHLQTKPDPYSLAERVNVKVDLTVLKSSYALTQEHVAQMNVDTKVDFVCPEAKPVAEQKEPDPTPAPIGFLPFGISPNQFLALRAAQPTRKDPNLEEPPTSPLDVLVDFEAFTFVPPSAKGKALIIEPIGGVRKLVSADYLKKQGDLRLTFNVTNTGKEERRIAVSHFAKFPRGLEGYRVEIPPVGGAFKPGETREVVALLTARPAEPPVIVDPPAPPVYVCPPVYVPIIVSPRCERPRLFRRWR